MLDCFLDEEFLLILLIVLVGMMLAMRWTAVLNFLTIAFGTVGATMIIQGAGESPTENIRANTDLSKCAYVTLVMMGDSYIPGALVTAMSIRNVRTGVNDPAIVCMVTDDVSDDACTALEFVFDEVVKVPHKS